MTKRITMPTRPKAVVEKSADDWVDKDVQPTVSNAAKPVRLTFDLDRQLHAQLRRHCLDHEIHVSAYIRRLISGSLSN